MRSDVGQLQSSSDRFATLVARPSAIRLTCRQLRVPLSSLFYRTREGPGQGMRAAPFCPGRRGRVGCYGYKSLVYSSLKEMSRLQAPNHALCEKHIVDAQGSRSCSARAGRVGGYIGAARRPARAMRSRRGAERQERCGTQNRCATATCTAPRTARTEHAEATPGATKPLRRHTDRGARARCQMVRFGNRDETRAPRVANCRKCE